MAKFFNLQAIIVLDCSEDSLVISYSNQNQSLIYCNRLEPPRFVLPSHAVTIRLLTKDRAFNGSTEQGFSLHVYFILQNGENVGEQCGVADVAPWSRGGQATPKIVGGLEAVVGSWPWMVRLKGANCGGTLISDR